MEDYISRIQAQRILGCNKDTMMRLLRSGEIESSRKENGGWLVSIESLEEFKKRRKDYSTNLAELQRLVTVYKEENHALKVLLNENGIRYEGIISEINQKSPTVSIIDLSLPKRVLVSLSSNGIYSIEQLRKMTTTELKSMYGIGKKTVNIIRSRLLISSIV